MQSELQVTFHNLPHSDALESDVRARFAKLEPLYDRLTACRVVIDSPHRTPSNSAKTYAVRIEMQLPGHELVVSREPVGDFRLALNDAFDTAKRRLKDHAEKQRAPRQASE